MTEIDHNVFVVVLGNISLNCEVIYKREGVIKVPVAFILLNYIETVIATIR